MHVLNAMHKCVSLSFVSDVYKDFNSLLKIYRRANEKMKSFGNRFEA